MNWYVLQTKTGSEEKLVGMIKKILPRDLYGECFVVYHEQLWRRQQQNAVHVKRVFPGYVFITAEEPDELFFCLKRVPAMSKLIADDEFFFLSLDEKEAEFLKRIMNDDHIIGLSYLSTDRNGKILQAFGPLEHCFGQEMRFRLRKRYVAVRLSLHGEEKEVLLGIVLDEDLRRELCYGKVEALIEVPDRYAVMAAETKENRGVRQELAPGDRVIAVEGGLAGVSGIVRRIRKNIARIGVAVDGHDIEIEMPTEGLRKTETAGERE